MKYNIGLDIGTNSIGWAVIDNDYNLVKIKSKTLWGTRIIETAQTAAKRREYRTTRRRYVRRKGRISKLQKIFNKEITMVDKDFFVKLNESFLQKEDRAFNKEKYTLFNDENYTDKDYYKEYKTIYHLRKKIIEDKNKIDIRLIYLALHNIIKYRGHFLSEGQDLSKSGKSEEKFEELKMLLGAHDLFELNISTEKFKEIIEKKDKSRKEKLELLELEIKNKSEKKFAKAIFNGILGLKFSLKDIFINDDIKEMLEGEDLKDGIKFSDINYEENEEKLENALEDRMEIVRALQAIYSVIQLNNILKEKDYISEAMVEGFEIYKSQLKLLKTIIKKYNFKDFKDIFKDNSNEKGYFFYNKNKSKYKDNFYKSIIKSLESIEKISIDENDRADIKYLKEEIANETLLIKQNTTLNSLIPYQLNLKELREIIKNQEQYYPFLKIEKEKIEKILTFKIPYYIGPLSKKNNDNAWAVRIEGMENTKIEPWNFNQVIDRDKSAELFIKRMLGKCTYFQDEYVIPKNSLLACDYVFYNEINKIKISSEGDNEIYLDKESKESLREVFIKNSKVQEKDIENWAIQNLNMKSTQNIKIKGLQGDKEATSTLKPYKDFEKILGTKITKENYKMVEEIILWITIFEDKKIAERKISSKYKELSNKQIGDILKLKYTGWLKLSKKLLDGITTKTSDGRKLTVIDILRDGSPNSFDYGKIHENLNQILANEKYQFKKILKEEGLSKEIKDKSYKNLIGNLQVSPALKRAVWQGIKIIEEIIKIAGDKPEKIFIEVARSDEESKRTKSKVNKLIKLYEDNKLDKTLLKLLKEVNINNEKQELYFRQQGKCIYTLEAIDIDRLNQYDVDHIIPRSYIKDDSIENKVLVKRERNQDRSDNITPRAFIETRKNKYEIIAYWEMLRKNGLIGDKKFRNLNLLTITEEQEFGFIARQLVESRQIIKNISNLLSVIYRESKTEVINVKAPVVDDFRKQFQIIKNRNVNNFHHAKDAYITASIGVYVNKKFPNFEEFYMKKIIKDEFKKYKRENTLKYKYGFIVGSMNKTSCNEDGEIIWEKDKTIAKIKKQLSYRDILVTRQTIKVKGQFYKDTINKKMEINKSDKAIEIKKGYNVYKYGYYTGENAAYSSIIEYKDKGKIKKILVKIPIQIDKQIQDANITLKEYLETQGYKDLKILKERVLKNQLIQNDKGMFYLASATEWHNATELILDNNSLMVIENYKKLSKKEDLMLVQMEKEFNEIIETLIKEKNLKENLKKDFEKLNYNGKLKKINDLISENKEGFNELLKFKEKLEPINIFENEKNNDDELMEIIKRWSEKVKVLYKIYDKLYSKILNKYEIIEDLKISYKLKVIFEFFKITKNNAETGNLTIIGLSDREGRLSKKNVDIENTKFINKSITGFYVSEEVF